MDALDRLTEDQQSLSRLLEAYAALTDHADAEAEKLALVERLRLELGAHALVMQELFFPALQPSAASDEQDALEQSQVELALVTDLAVQLEGLLPSEPALDVAVRLLQRLWAMHVEQDAQLQRWARTLDLDFNKLGDRMARRGDALLSGEVSAAPAAVRAAQALERDDEDADPVGRRIQPVRPSA